jgi:predicted GNAT family acetyltransferase
VAFDIDLAGSALDLAVEAVARLSTGLIRCEPNQAARLWGRLERAGRRAQIDRREWTLHCPARQASPAFPSPGVAEVREAHLADLEALVEAARASLREEGRPDPFVGDPHGFRRWVRNRLPRALVAEQAGRVAFVGYSDVQLQEGWLLQGVYTWPAFRRRGLARAGVAALCARAFAAGAEHVQLSVVEGNEAAQRLYENLGFERLGQVRTLLFEAPER